MENYLDKLQKDYEEKMRQLKEEQKTSFIKNLKEKFIDLEPIEFFLAMFIGLLLILLLVVIIGMSSQLVASAYCFLNPDHKACYNHRIEYKDTTK